MAEQLLLKTKERYRPTPTVRQPLASTPFDVVAIVRRRLLLIAGVAVVTVGLAVVYLAGLVPRYVSVAQIALGEQGLSGRSTFDLLETQTLTSAVIEGELAVLRSGALLMRVVDRLDLQNSPEFNAALRPPEPESPIISSVRENVRQLRTSIQSLVSEPAEDEAPAPDGPTADNSRIAAAAAGDPLMRENNAIIGQLHQKIEVRQLGSSFVVQIAVSSEDPVMAAAIGNTLMEEYIRFLTDKRFQAAQRFTNWLEVRVAELAITLEESERAALAFRSTMEADANNGERLAQQMRELTSKIVDARAELALTAAQAARSVAIAERDGPLAAADILSSDEIMRYRADLGELRRESANAAIGFGAESLQVASIGRAIEQIEVSIAVEVNRAIEELRNRAEVSESVVGSLEAALSEIEERAQALSSDEIALNQLNRVADANKLVYEEFLGRFKETSEIQNLQSADAEVISFATLPTGASYPRKKVGVVLAAAGGVFGGLALAFLLELTPRHIRSADQLSHLTGLSVYGRLPKLPKRGKVLPLLRVLERRPGAPLAQSARRLLSNADIRAGSRARSIVVAGAGPGDAKSGVAFMLAWAAIQSGRSCILVDADIRTARLSRALNHGGAGNNDSRATLIDVLHDNAPLDEAVRTVTKSGLKFVACSPTGSDPALIFSTRSAGAIVAELLKSYDTVIFDAPLMASSSDALKLPMECDVGLFVVEAGRTRPDEIETGLGFLSESNLGNIGTVLTSVRHANG